MLSPRAEQWMHRLDWAAAVASLGYGVWADSWVWIGFGVVAVVLAWINPTAHFRKWAQAKFLHRQQTEQWRRQRSASAPLENVSAAPEVPPSIPAYFWTVHISNQFHYRWLR